MNIIGFLRRHAQNIDLRIRKLAVARSIETITLAGVQASYACNGVKELARVKQLGGERLMDLLLESHIKPGDIVHDIGGNIGFYSVLFAKKAGPKGCVYAYEPETINFERLRVNADLNKLPNLYPCPFAISSETRMLWLRRHSSEPGEGAHGLVGAEGDLTQPVFCFALDELIAKFKLPGPTVVKIDIEGHEMDALLGMQSALKESVRVIFVEIHYYRYEAAGRYYLTPKESEEHHARIVKLLSDAGLPLAEEDVHHESGPDPLHYTHSLFVRK